MKWKGNSLRLFLDADLYLGLVKLQADRELGWSYAGLLVFNEGLYNLGFISEAVYEKHKRKYSVGLKPKSRQLKLQEHREVEERRQLNRQFGEVIVQWLKLKPKSRRWWRQKAMELPDLPNAKKLLAYAEERKKG